MPVAAAIVGAGAISAGASIYGASKAASAQEKANREAIASRERMFKTAEGYAAPFITAGQGALPTLSSLLTPGADMSAVLSQIPGFKFAQDWGQRGITQQNSARGAGGNVMKAGADYATGAASQTYGGIVNALLGYAGLGSGAAGALGGAAINTGSGIAGNQVGIGNAQAGSYMSMANSVGDAAGSVGNLVALNSMTGGKLFGSGGGTGMYGPYGAYDASNRAMGPR